MSRRLAITDSDSVTTSTKGTATLTAGSDEGCASAVCCARLFAAKPSNAVIITAHGHSRKVSDTTLEVQNLE
jgi:hypothetical protein